MAGILKIHPLIKTYEECRRTVARLEQFVNQWQEQLTGDQVHRIHMMIEKTEEVANLIPEQYRLSHTEIRELYKRERSN